MNIPDPFRAWFVLSLCVAFVPSLCLAQESGCKAFSSQWTEAQPNEPSAWYYLGNAYGPTALNQLKNLIQPYRRAAQSKARNFGLSQKALDEGKKEAADAASASDWCVLGNGHSRPKIFAADVNAYQRCLRLDGRGGPAWTSLAAARGETGNIRGPLDNCKQAAALCDPLGRSNLATLTEATKKVEEQRQQTQGCDASCAGGKMDAGQMRHYFADHPGALLSEANNAVSP